MSEQSIYMNFPLDPDGFLRRECPNCERQFKWYNSSPSDTEHSTAMEESQEPAEFYFCPYCHDPAALTSWWTSQQLRYIQEAQMKALEPELRGLANNVQQAGAGGHIQISVNMPHIPAPEPPVETDDMIRVEFPCHPAEPIKVLEEWEQPVACLVCGIRYPVDIVRAIPNTTGNGMRGVE